MSEAAPTDQASQLGPGGVIDVAAVGEDLLRDARDQHSRRAARTVIGSTTLRVTVIALLEGAALAEHSSPPTATLQAVRGAVRLQAGDVERVVSTGELVRIPPQRHSLRADSDAVVLLTVALH